MTIYKMVINENESVLSAEPLSPGEHTLKHGGASIRVNVEREDVVTVFLNSFNGDSWDLYLGGIEDDAEASMLQRGEIRALTIKTLEGKAAVGLLGVDDGLDTRLVLKSLSERPAVRSERGRG